MFRSKYYLNPETLRFERVNPPVRKRLLNGFFWCVFLLLFSTVLRVSFDKILNSPKIVIYTERSIQLRNAYNMLAKEIIRAEHTLSELQKKDDRLYRSILDLEPIPYSIREAGFGGSENYIDVLMNRSDESVVGTARQLEKLVNKVKIQMVSLQDLTEMATMQKDLISGKPLLRPISPGDAVWLTSSFGYRWDPFTKGRRMHQGIDLAGNIGINIYSSGDGKVIDAGMSRQGYGREVLIDHGFGYTTRYAHLNKVNVKVGDQIKRGQLIGKLGNSGRSTGPHLHYEVRLHGRAMNPMYFFYENITPEEYTQIVSQHLN